MKKNIIINNKTYSIPAGLHDVSYEKFCNLVNTLQEYKGSELDLKVFCALIGCQEEEVKQIKNIKDYLDIVVSFGTWEFHKIDYSKIQVPKSVIWNEVPLIIPTDFGDLELGLFEDCRAEMKKDLNNFKVLQQVYLDIATLYLYRLKFGEYDYDKAMQYKNEIKTIYWEVIFGIGIFFLQKVAGLLNGTMQELSKQGTLPKKLKQGTKERRRLWGLF